jgi:hypothetical protein
MSNTARIVLPNESASFQAPHRVDMDMDMDMEVYFKNVKNTSSSHPFESRQLLLTRSYLVIPSQRRRPIILMN